MFLLDEIRSSRREKAALIQTIVAFRNSDRAQRERERGREGGREMGGHQLENDILQPPPLCHHREKSQTQNPIIITSSLPDTHL